MTWLGRRLTLKTSRLFMPALRWLLLGQGFLNEVSPSALELQSLDVCLRLAVSPRWFARHHSFGDCSRGNRTAQDSGAIFAADGDNEIAILTSMRRVLIATSNPGKLRDFE